MVVKEGSPSDNVYLIKQGEFLVVKEKLKIQSIKTYLVKIHVHGLVRKMLMKLVIGKGLVHILIIEKQVTLLKLKVDMMVIIILAQTLLLPSVKI